jgi:hypothetical protein
MNPKIASISLIIATLAAASPAHAGFADGLAGGIAGGIISGAINAATHPQPRTVVVEKKVVVVHEHRSAPPPHHAAAKTADPSPTPTPAPALPPAPAPAVNHGPILAVTNPVKIDKPTDLTAKELALTQGKSAVLAFFEDYFKRTTPQNSLADSSLFMEVQIGAYSYLVAKITENTEIGTVMKGFVIDLKNEYMTVLKPNVYAEFMRTGNIQLLGEKFLNPLDF